MDAVNISAWEGRTQTEAGEVSALQAATIHVTLGGSEAAAPRAGDPLPPLWHWCGFPPVVANADLSQDGHPHLGAFLPPLNLRRRMWAGGALSFHAPLAVGDALERRSTVLRLEDKGTPERPMVFVTLQHEIMGPLGLAVRERQTLVYMQIPETFVAPKKRPMPERAVARRQVAVTEASLFRFSAITFNAHRIHYDLPYAQTVEHYPGLVIHGPLQAMLLMNFATRHAGRAPSMFEFRGQHPMFLGAGDLDLAAEDQGDGAMSLACGQAGHVGTSAHAVWEGTQ